MMNKKKITLIVKDYFGHTHRYTQLRKIEPLNILIAENSEEYIVIVNKAPFNSKIGWNDSSINLLILHMSQFVCSKNYEYFLHKSVPKLINAIKTLDSNLDLIGVRFSKTKKDIVNTLPLRALHENSLWKTLESEHTQ